MSDIFHAHQGVTYRLLGEILLVATLLVCITTMALLAIASCIERHCLRDTREDDLIETAFRR